MTLLIAVALGLGLMTDPTQEAAFKDFIKWYRTYTGSVFPEEIRKAYTADLLRRGLTQDEADRQVKAASEAVGKTPTPPEFVALNFDKIYTSANPPFKQEPSAYLARMVEDLKPGTALDCGMGNGRNAVFLAAKGWEVTGYDLSAEGVAKARAAAAKLGLKLNAVVDSHEVFDLGHEKWDLVVQAYAWTNLKDDAYRKRLIDSLKPGGVLVVDGFGDPSGKSKNTLIDAFRDLRVIDYQARNDIADWGLRKIAVERIVLRKD